MSDAPERLWAEPDGGEIIIHNGDPNLNDLIATGFLTEYVRADRIEAIEAERDALAEKLDLAVETVNRLPPGEWEVWTSCSFRRITARGGPDGGVLSGIIQHSDGHPDLSWNEKQCQALCDLVNGLRAAYRTTEGQR